MTGIVTKVSSAYSAKHGNITLTLKIGEKTIDCYRLGDGDADFLHKVFPDDQITVTGGIEKNSNGYVQFKSGCVASNWVDNTAEIAVPPANFELSLATANAIAAKFPSNVYTFDKYYVEGEITEITNTQYGNMTISDGTNEFDLYGLYLENGTRYDGMENKPQVGDTIRVYGTIGNFKGANQMANGWLVAANNAEGAKSNPYTLTLDANTISASAWYKLTMPVDSFTTISTASANLALFNVDGDAITLAQDAENYVYTATLTAGEYLFYVSNAGQENATLSVNAQYGITSKPVVIGGEEGANPDVPGTFTAPVGTTFYVFNNTSSIPGKFSVEAGENVTVTLLEAVYNQEYAGYVYQEVTADYLEVAGNTNVYVKVVVTGEAAANWTLAKELPVGAESNPLVVTQPSTQNITVAAGAKYYVTLKGDLEFVIPNGFTAVDANNVSYAAGAKVVASANAENGLVVALTNTGDESATVSLAVVAPLTQADIVNIAYALGNYKYTDEAYTLTGTVIAIDGATASKANVTFVVAGCEDKPILAYYLTGTGIADVALGDEVTVSGHFQNYNGKIEFTQIKENNVVKYAGPTLNAYNADATVSDIAKAATEKYALAITTAEFENAAEFTLVTAGKTYTNVAISYTCANAAVVINGGKISVASVTATTTFKLVAKFSVNGVDYLEKELSFTVKFVAANEQTATISFANKAQRTEFSASKQVWVQNGITVTNNKSSSTSSVGDYAAPARFYKSSELIIEIAGMKEIVFTCNTTSYASSLGKSIGSTATVSGKTVTVTLAEATNKYTIKLSDGQVRMDSLTVKYSK